MRVGIVVKVRSYITTPTVGEEFFGGKAMIGTVRGELDLLLLGISV